MRVAIKFPNTYNTGKALRKFTSEFWRQLALSQPDHQFIFFTIEKITWQPPANLTVRLLKSTGFSWLDERNTRKVLVEQQANKLVSIQDAGFIVHNILPGKANNKSILPAHVEVLFKGNGQPAAHKELAGSIKIITPAFDGVITSLTWAEAESIKTQYTGGRSFFLFTGDIDEHHQLIELLKAFSIFKKWQQSNMQLVIAGSATHWTEDFEEKLQTYKYRDDVVLLQNINHTETASLVAASYALVYPVAGHVFPLGLLWAVQAHKAAIATDNPPNRQLTDAATWVEAGNTAEGFAKAMLLLYKDESQQQLLVQQTKEQAAQFNRQQMLADVWRCIEH